MDQGQRGAAGHHRAAGGPALVEDRPVRSGGDVHQVRGQAHRVREGQGRHIVVLTKDELPTVIDTLIAAVRAGELDELFTQAAKTGTIGKAA